MFKVNDNATCLLGKELTKQCALFQAIVTHATPVLLCLDNDAMRATLDTAKLLYDYNIDVRILELPEEIKDPGEISKNRFLELRETNTVEFDEMYYLRNIIK
jgi:DNA primase